MPFHSMNALMIHHFPAATTRRSPSERTSNPRWRSALCASTLALFCLASPHVAHAQPSAPEATNLDVARTLAVAGREAFNSGDYETALARFRKAYELYPAPTVVLYEARTLEKMGLLLEAVEAYSRTTRIAVPVNAPAQFGEAIAAAHAESEALQASIPTLSLELRGVGVDDPNLNVTLNGRPLDTAELLAAQSLNPGTYRVAASVGLVRRFASEVTLVPGQSRRVIMNLGAPSLDPLGADGEAAARGQVGAELPTRRSVPTLAYVAGGIGVAGVSVGVVTGLLANDKYDRAQELCDDHRCAAGTPGPDAVDAFRTWRMISSVSYGVGAAGIAAGVVLWLTASEHKDKSQAGTIEPWGTAKAAGIRGTF